MTAREKMRRLFKEADAITNPSKEQSEDIRVRAKPIIEAACREQYKEVGAVLTPVFCLNCMGCPIGTMLKGIAN